MEMPKDIGTWEITHKSKKGRRINEFGDIRWDKTNK